MAYLSFSGGAVRKICIVTGTRAEYGLLSGLMKYIAADPGLKLQIIVTGMHLSPEFGYTYKDIEREGFHIDKKVEMLLSSDTSVGIAKSTGLGMIGLAEAFKDLFPDIVVILGDRFEMLAAAFAAIVAGIPIAHIHGGEVTTGVVDEAIRHAISKMSWWHFTATETYRKRVIQLGESPERVYNCGGLGVAGIRQAALMSKPELEKALNFKFGKKNLLVTYHPVTYEKQTAAMQVDELLSALDSCKNTKILFTFPNADSEGRVIKQKIMEYVSRNRSSSVFFSSMGKIKYWSTMQYVDAVVGNSSSGLLEAPTFKIGTINIGDRQNGRIKADSVIDCRPDATAISEAINKLYSSELKHSINFFKNPYEGENTSGTILGILKNSEIPKNLKKAFYDL